MWPSNYETHSFLQFKLWKHSCELRWSKNAYISLSHSLDRLWHSPIAIHLFSIHNYEDSAVSELSWQDHLTSFNIYISRSSYSSDNLCRRGHRRLGLFERHGFWIYSNMCGYSVYMDTIHTYLNRGRVTKCLAADCSGQIFYSWDLNFLQCFLLIVWYLLFVLSVSVIGILIPGSSMRMYTIHRQLYLYPTF